MKLVSHVVRKKMNSAVGRAIESLESRTLLSATLTSPISNVTVTQDSAPTTIDLNNNFDDPSVTEPTVTISTVKGNIPIELFPDVTPLNVANFLGYVDSGEYNGTIVHRNAKDPSNNPFVIQGGGYTPDGNHIDTSRSGSGVPDEFHFSNTRGTVAMAKTSSPNSATSEWFINESDSNTFLDAQNFTVFGRVLYNGMTAVDAIANLPNTSATNLNSAFTDLPLLDAAGGAVPNNMVVTNITRSPHIVISPPVSDNPSLVTPSLGANNQLVLTYGAGQSGFAHITVTATDLGGNSVSQVFRVHVTGTTPGDVVIGAGTAFNSIVWTQPDGTVVTQKLSGPGTETVAFPTAVTTTTKGKTVIVDPQLDPDISIVGSTGATKVSFSASKGSKIARIGDFTTDSDLGTLSGKSVNLDGDLTIGGSAKSITLNNASDGAITIGAGPLALALKTTAALTDEIITSAAAIKSISTPAISGTSSATSSLTAPSVGSISVTKGGVSNSSITLTAAAANDLGKLSIKGAAQSLFINSTGGLGAISAASMANTIIHAGVAALSAGQVLPNFPADFASVQSIKSVKVKNGKFPTFSNSSIAAEVIGSLSLGRVQTNNGGTSFGVAATSISSLTGTDQTTNKKFSMHKITAADVQALLAKLGFSLADFVIKMF